MKFSTFNVFLLVGIITASCLLPVGLVAQYGTLSTEERTEYTHLNPYDRFPDGRPKVPDSILERMKKVSTEEAWGVLRRHGYNFQFEGNWMNPFPDRVLVGRAVTASFVPLRPDLNDLTNKKGEKDGRIGAQNSWVIDTLVENDVIVIDLFGKIVNGTYAGDNLANSIFAKSKTGFVVDGAVRDLEGIMTIPGISFFIRGVDPTGIGGVTLRGINIPIRIGNVTVMPGDIVLGRREGIIFIPPQFAEEVCESSERIRLRDEFGHQMLREGRFTPGQIDRKWTDDIIEAFEEWKKEKGIKEK